MNNKIVVVKVENLRKHPQANKLNICEVFTGTEHFQIVCGAQNIVDGMITVLAMPQATLPNGKIIKLAQLRGVESNGMLCSALDLDIAQEKGIIDLPTSTDLGQSYEAINIDLLSSTPWHRFKLVDSHWLDSKTERIHVINHTNSESELKLDWQCISKTYFDGESYRYRHFS